MLKRDEVEMGVTWDILVTRREEAMLASRKYWWFTDSLGEPLF